MTTTKRRTPAEAGELDARIRRGILENRTVPQVAESAGIPTTYCYTLMQRRLGVTKALLLPHEHVLVREARAKLLRQSR